MAERLSVKACPHNSHRPIELVGGDARLLLELIEAGPVGVTCRSPARPRIGGHVLNLKSMGFNVETLSGRYVLRSPVEIWKASKKASP
jgi:hypothetical protein